MAKNQPLFELSADKKTLLYANADEVDENDMTSITIPDGVLRIGDKACSWCSADSIIIPNSVTTIGYHAFTFSCIKSIIIPNGVTSIEEGAFICCSSLESVTLPESLTKIGKDVFHHCSNLKEVIVPIGSKAHFSQMKNLESVWNLIKEEGSTIDTVSPDSTIEQACIKCKKMIPKAYAFCPYCGMSIVHACPNPMCGKTDIPHVANFCPECGTRLK